MARPISRGRLPGVLEEITFGNTSKLFHRGIYGWLFCWGDTVPDDHATGYGKGCIWLNTDGADVDHIIYINDGDETDADFELQSGGGGGSDFGAEGIDTDKIDESTLGAGVTIDGVRLKDSLVRSGSGGVPGLISIYPPTISRGQLQFACANQNGDTTVYVQASAMDQATTLSIPDPGASTASFVLSTTTVTPAQVAVLAGVTAGTVTASKALVVDSDKDLSSLRDIICRNVDAGASGTAGTLDVFPTTGSSGKLTIAVTDQGADDTITLQIDAMGQATAVHVPDPGAAASYLVQSTLALTPAEVDVLDAVTPGTVAASLAVVVDSDKDISAFRNVIGVNFDAGASGVAGTVDIFPTTGSKGKIALAAADSAGDYTLTITNASLATASRICTIPDPGAAANFVMSQGDAEITGIKTFLSELALGKSATKGYLDLYPTTASSGKLRISTGDIADDGTAEIQFAAHAAARTYTVPDCGAAASFVMSQLAQTITGVKSFATSIAVDSIAEYSGAAGVTIDGVLCKDYAVAAGSSGNAGAVDIFPTTASKGKLRISTGDITDDGTAQILFAAHAAARDYTVPDCGAAASFVMSQLAQTISGVKTFASALATSAGVGAKAGAGVTVVEQGDGVFHKSVFTFTAQQVTITDLGAGDKGVGALKFYDFPEGIIYHLGQVVDLVATKEPEGGIIDAFDGDFSVGTHLNTDNEITTTDKDMVAETAVGPATVGVADVIGVSTATEQVLFDGHTVPIDAHVNILIDNDSISASSYVTLDGTITLTWINLGDYT